jgi:signal peptidase I
LKFVYEIIETSFIAIIIFFALYLTLTRPHQVIGDSMLPSYHNGEYLLTEIATYKVGGRDLSRGDVVVFRPPEQTKPFIKRIIALPNERIKIQNGRVLIANSDFPEGVLLEEDYLAPGTRTQSRSVIHTGDFFETGDGYVVMGDNREFSFDSRNWGVIEKEDIIGRAWLRYWPPSALGLISPPEYPK